MPHGIIASYFFKSLFIFIEKPWYAIHLLTRTPIAATFSILELLSCQIPIFSLSANVLILKYFNVSMIVFSIIEKDAILKVLNGDNNSSTIIN